MHKRGWGVGGTVGGHGRGRTGALGSKLRANRSRQWVSARSVGGDGGKVGPGRRSRPAPGGRTSVAGAPDPRSDGTARMVVAHSARNYKPTGLGSGCRRGRWGVTVRGVGPVRRRAGAQAWLMHRRIHVRTARQGWWWPTRLEITSQPVSAVGVGAVGGG